MAGVKFSRWQQTQAAAQRLVAVVFPDIDQMSSVAANTVLIGLYKQLQEDQGVVRDTAKSHISRALRVARGQGDPGGWAKYES